MSSHETDSSCSYDSDDSDINFLSDYVLEVEDEASTTNQQGSTSASTCEVDSDTFQPYADEPIADDEWLEEYNSQQESQVQFERQLQSRFDGNEDPNSWCECGNCRIECLQNPNEFQCCVEIQECVESLSSDLVLEEVTNPLDCVTQYPGFDQVCLSKWSLRLAADKYRTKNKSRYRQTESEEKFLRGVAYREFTRLIHGYLGGKRIPLPACAYTKIREKFTDVAYTGFEVEDDEM